MTPDQEITSPSGRKYAWTKDTPPTAEDWKALQEHDASLGSDADKMKARLPGMQDMLNAPVDAATGKPFKANIPHPPRGTLPILAGMASALIPGGLLASTAYGTLAGAAGDATESLLHGEKPSIPHMAGAGVTQGAWSAAPAVAKPTGRVMASVGNKLAGFVAGPIAKTGIGIAADAVLHAAGVPRGFSELGGFKAVNHAAPLVESGVRAAGRATSSAGDALAQAATSKSGQAMGSASVGPVKKLFVEGSRVPMLPDALRKLQLLYQVLTANKNQ